jgi:hypothetical protein
MQVSIPTVAPAAATSTHDLFGVTDAVARATQHRSRIQRELRRLPPSKEPWVQRCRQRLLAAFVLATDEELSR